MIHQKEPISRVFDILFVGISDSDSFKLHSYVDRLKTDRLVFPGKGPLTFRLFCWLSMTNMLQTNKTIAHTE